MALPSSTAGPLADTRRPRRVHSGGGPDVAVFFEFSTLGLVLCGYLAMLSTGTLDLATSIVVCVALIYRTVALAGLLPMRFPGWLLGSLTLAAIFLYPVDLLWWSADFIQATVHLIFVLALLKLLSAQGIRDHVALLVLSFLLLVVAAVLSSDSLFFLFLLGFLTFSVMSFTSLELRRSLQAQHVATSGMVRLPFRLTLFSLSISVGILAMSLGLFYALPRTAKAALNQLMIQRGAGTGFAREVVLGRFGEITQNPAVVMRIREIDLPVEQSRAPFPVHWRGATLSEFDGRRWSSSMEAGDLTEITNSELFLESAAQRRRPGARGGYEVHLASGLGDFLFAPGLPEFLRVNQPFVFRYRDRSLRLRATPNEELQYAVFSYLDGESELAEGRVAALSSTELGADRPTDLLDLPPLDPRIAELAADVTDGFDNPLDKARILASYLRGNYRYRLETQAAGRRDPLAHFLFDSREGHCEYFASALTVMLRSQGIPARMVTGFVAREYNPLTGWHVVRMSDAHSWVEAWLPGRGWLGFDPTPSSRMQPMSQILARLRLWQDTVDTFWNDWVLSYDFSRQLSLAISIEQAGGQLRDGLQSVTSAVRRISTRRADWTVAWLPGSLAAGLLLVILLRRRSQRKSKTARVEKDPLPEAALLYQQALAQLSQKGYAKPAWQTSAEFAKSLGGFPEMQAFVGFTHAYQQARYGNRTEALVTMKELSPRIATLPARPMNGGKSRRWRRG